MGEVGEQSPAGTAGLAAGPAEVSPDLSPRSAGRVVFCSNTLRYLWNFRRSTLESFLARGVRVLCIGQADRTVEDLRALGCEVLPLPWRLRTVNPLSEAPIVARMVVALARFRPDICFSFTFQANTAIAASSKLLGIPYVTNVSGLGTAFLNERFSYRLLRRLYGWVNAGAYATFFQNSSDLELFLSLGLSIGRRTSVLPGSGVNTERFAFQPLDGPVRSFLMVSRLMQDKGAREYLEAAAIAKARRPDLSFVLVGPEEAGPGRITREEILTHAAHVDYAGEVSDVRPLLYAADCLVLPSYREGMPRTVLEAASAGRVALVSDVEGCRHAIVEGETGFLFQPRSADSLAHAMLQVAGLEAPRVAAISAAARELAVSRFDEHLCIAPYERLYEGLVRARGRPAAGASEG